MEMKKLFYLPLFLFVFVISCKEKHIRIEEKVVVEKPAELGPTASEIIKATLENAIENKHVDSFYVNFPTYVHAIYLQNDFALLWTKDGKWLPKADSLFSFISNSTAFGLFPQHYHIAQIQKLRHQTISDTAKRDSKLDASLWAKTELILTSSFVQIVKDLKIGRLIKDDIVLKDTLLKKEFFVQSFANYQQKHDAEFATALEPKHTAYHELKGALQNFLATADLRPYTYVDPLDSANINKLVQQRLSEEDETIQAMPLFDSIQLGIAIIDYQERKGLKNDGKIGPEVIGTLNATDHQKFTRIAVTLDRYKQLPKLPKQYLWVNIPSFRLVLKENDSTVITSKVVVGKPVTRTPVLTSSISDMITYPKWHIPNSIIKNDILPNLKKDPGYLARKGYSLWDWKGVEVDPFSVDWTRFEKEIPYQVIQGSGDDNALGVIKFNFPNKHAVYLHDTNQRSLFSRQKRALSHGCVRVESWRELAYYLLEKDNGNKNAVPLDSLQTWLNLKEKRVIPLRKRVPLYIRYFTCEAKEGDVVFYDDIYGEDKRLSDEYFLTKKIL